MQWYYTIIIIGFVCVQTAILYILLPHKFEPICNDQLSNNSPQERLVIHVYIPHYKNEITLMNCVALLQKRQSNEHIIKYFIITQEDTVEERANIRRHFEGQQIHVIDFPQGVNVIGGSALPGFFKLVNNLNHGSNVTLTIDVDAFILASNWDLRIAQIFKNPNVQVAAINPRVFHGPAFHNIPEWNFMAFRSEFFYYPLSNSWPLLHDWGHMFLNWTLEKNQTIHLWQNPWYPIEGKTAMVVGDEFNPTWVLHFFFTTRKRNEHISHNELLTDEQMDNLIQWAHRDNIKKTFP